jgi:hypothetical protein
MKHIFFKHETRRVALSIMLLCGAGAFAQEKAPEGGSFSTLIQRHELSAVLFYDSAAGKTDVPNMMQKLSKEKRYKDAEVAFASADMSKDDVKSFAKKTGITQTPVIVLFERGKMVSDGVMSDPQSIGSIRTFIDDNFGDRIDDILNNRHKYQEDPDAYYKQSDDIQDPNQVEGPTTTNIYYNYTGDYGYNYWWPYFWWFGSPFWWGWGFWGGWYGGYWGAYRNWGGWHGNHGHHHGGHHGAASHRGGTRGGSHRDAASHRGAARSASTSRGTTRSSAVSHGGATHGGGGGYRGGHGGGFHGGGGGFHGGGGHGGGRR